MVDVLEGHDEVVRKHHKIIAASSLLSVDRRSDLTKAGDGRGITHPPLKSKPQRLKPPLFRRYLRQD